MKPPPPTPRTEEEFIAALVEATLAKQRRKHRPGHDAKRDVHIKSHGRLQARFSVRAAIPAECKVGVFAVPRDYDAVVRFSNGAFGASAPDILPNIRGVALKLNGVPGTKLLPGDEGSTEHDFVLANHPVFFAPKIEHMFLFMTHQFRALYAVHPRFPSLMHASMAKLISSPLHVSYYSQVPYALGQRACKYALVPTEAAPRFAISEGLKRHYLRAAVEKTLRAREVTYQFCVQLQRDAAGESIDDSSAEWTGPFVPVADVTFLKVPGPVLESNGEHLSFNPWRVLQEHRPLGWPGRARRAVYAADYQWRTEQNRSR